MLSEGHQAHWRVQRNILLRNKLHTQSQKIRLRLQGCTIHFQAHAQLQHQSQVLALDRFHLNQEKEFTITETYGDTVGRIYKLDILLP